MNWKELLKQEIDQTYRATEGLIELVQDSELEWKPATGENWMSMGQLLRHITDACGMCCKGFVTGDWGMPDDFDPSTISPEEMLPPADQLPTIHDVEKAKKRLAEDKILAYKMVDDCLDEDLHSKIATAPWDARERVLGHRLLEMILHLHQHKGQLFYYLKLQGKKVNTHHLWGINIPEQQIVESYSSKVNSNI